MAATPTRTEDRPASRRTIRPPRGLPSSRAAVGGLLVAVAAIGTWAVATGDRATDEPRYVVAARPVAAGVELTEADLTATNVALPPSLRSSAFSDSSDLVGAVTRGPLGTGELVQSASVTTGAVDAGSLELSFAVDPAWAVGGALAIGDRIDVHATDADGATERVLADVPIIRLTDPDAGGLGANGIQTVTVAGSDPAAVAAAVAAIREADVTVVRRNGTVRPAEDEPADETDDEGER